jgi:hypothetical protein
MSCASRSGLRASLLTAVPTRPHQWSLTLAAIASGGNDGSGARGGRRGLPGQRGNPQWLGLNGAGCLQPALMVAAVPAGLRIRFPFRQFAHLN